jgi:hypothetical protein
MSTTVTPSTSGPQIKASVGIESSNVNNELTPRSASSPFGTMAEERQSGRSRRLTSDISTERETLIK